jgi:hypothetical protein
MTAIYENGHPSSNYCQRKSPSIEGLFIRGKKVVSQKLASNGDSGIGKKLNKITSIGFCKCDKRN